MEAPPGEQAGDYQAWGSVGPFLNVPPNGFVTCTVAFAVARGTRRTLLQFPGDYQAYAAALDQGLATNDNEQLHQANQLAGDLMNRYPVLANAISAQIAYEGVYERPREGFETEVPDCYGCESRLRLAEGEAPKLVAEECGEATIQKQVTSERYTWFNFDCNFCTGAYDGTSGYYHRSWNAESPPPSPLMNVAATYNYTDNPGRDVAPGGDNGITLAWDNLSEITPDPKTNWFDFRTYRIWKVSGWTRPVGSSGPSENDWSLLAEFRLFDHADSNYTRDPQGNKVCPMVYVPNYRYPAGDPQCSQGTAVPLSSGGCRDAATVPICLKRGDFWDAQSGELLTAQDVRCVPKAEPNPNDPADTCATVRALKAGSNTIFQTRTRYPIGRYVYHDPEVKNGFTYFYSVTAGDSTGQGVALSQLESRRAAVEAEGVVPQASTSTAKSVWVVPNPYRGYEDLAQRSSAWDLTPNATDPTGTHIDFMGLPAGPWTIRIFTVSGDLVAELHENDPVNESVRGTVVDESGTPRPVYNRQQDTPNDGQARWNLISRNGQDVVSGIYLFVVESDLGQQRGKFVIIR
jgi:hypothetical protein